MRPRPETIKKVLNFSKDYEKNAAESWGEIFESFANSDAKGLVICKGAPSEDIIDILKSHFDEKNKEDLSVNNEENIKIVSSDEILKNDKNLDEQN